MNINSSQSMTQQEIEQVLDQYEIYKYPFKRKDDTIYYDADEYPEHINSPLWDSYGLKKIQFNLGTTYNTTIIIDNKLHEIKFDSVTIEHSHNLYPFKGHIY